MSKSQTVRERVNKIAHDFDVEGFGGAKPAKAPRKKTAYQEFVAKHRKGNKHTMAEISKMWKEKNPNSGSKKVASKKVVSKSIEAKPNRAKPIKKENALQEVHKLMMKAKDLGIKFDSDEKEKIFKNHGVTRMQYKNSKMPKDKNELKKKMLMQKKK